MERYIPGKRRAKKLIKKWKAWHAPTIDNVCNMQFRMERLEKEAEKIRQRWVEAPELAALYVERKGAIPFYFMPRPQPGKPRLIVDNKPKAGRSQSARGPRCA
jgi:hypothetical protein